MRIVFNLPSSYGQDGQSRESYPTLLPLLMLLGMARRAVGAVRHLGRAVPRALGLGAFFHRAVPGAHRRLCGRCGALRWWLRRGILPQQRSQPGEEPGFIGIAQGDLHLAAFEQDMAVDAGWCLWQ
jgi:hypothetical protein